MRIYVKSANGKVFFLRMTGNETIEQLKERIFLLTGIPPERQTLFNDDRPLASLHHTLTDCGVRKQSVLFLESTVAFKRKVEIQMKGKNIVIWIRSLEDIRTLKEKIEKSEGIPASQQTLIYNGQVLKNERKLIEYCIDSPLFLFLLHHFNGEVIIELDDGRRVNIPVKGTDTIKTIKSEIEKSQFIPLMNQSLYRQMSPLHDDEALLADCEIYNGTVLHLLSPSTITSSTNPFHFFIKSWTGRISLYKCRPDDTIAHIKNLIFQRERSLATVRLTDNSLSVKDLDFADSVVKNLHSKHTKRLSVNHKNHPQSCRLTYNGSVLKDDRTLSHYRIGPLSLIFLRPPIVHSYQIFVETQTPPSLFAFDIRYTDVISAVLKKALEHSGRQCTCPVPSDVMSSVFFDGMGTDTFNPQKKTLSSVFSKSPVLSSPLYSSAVDSHQSRSSSVITYNNCKSRLFYKGIRLKELKAIANYNIEENSTLFLTPCSPVTLAVCVEDNRHEIQVNAYDLVKDVKSKIKNELEIQCDDLVVEGSSLLDDVCITQCTYENVEFCVVTGT
jgi:hypothetical protein